MKSSIAIVGMACQYPDASSPSELWANALSARRAFRTMPSVRMNPADYLSADKTNSDTTYVMQAAVIDGYEFDRVAFRVAGGTFRSADMAHWLALDVASRAIADAGFPEGEGLPREMTGVMLGNTLTGEFSRANQLRLRWPFVRRTVEQELLEAGWAADDRAAFLARLEGRYKAPFPPIGEETLAGGLSNTIAGRICNYFDLKGGGFTVDGACASSLLAVANACSALTAGDLDVAIAGGVDLSLDPFELIGFARTGALAPEKMRVYDARSAGFWPGEGCGFVVLMRQADAVAAGHRVLATIEGWGISSDGSGGITRPEVEGQILALRRAYARAGFGIDTVTYFEGHGTGTNVGDVTELATISRARREANPLAPAAAIGSVKAIIGHTKAAAGAAGLIKAVMALQAQIVPPTVGNDTPHAELQGERPALTVVRQGHLWPADRPLVAGVSAMGFGGINAHLVLAADAPRRRARLNARERTLLRSAQDAEVFLLAEQDVDGLLQKAETLATTAAAASLAQLSDLADMLAHRLGEQPVRAAIVAGTPAELAERLRLLASWLRDGITDRLDVANGVFLGANRREPRVAFLFPGQGSPAHLDGGLMRRRFDSVDALYQNAGLPTNVDGVSTDIAQPAIATASRAMLELLERFGVVADVALGHSLGELVALHWAGAYDGDALVRIARARGRAMADLGAATGAMASIAAPESDVRALMRDEGVVIAGLNSPRQTVISGEAAGVDAVLERARQQGLHASRLPVSHAFHSPLVAAAAEPVADALDAEDLQPLEHTVVSTVTGRVLDAEADLRALLLEQIVQPVRFIEAATQALGHVDLAIEVGPGSVLTGLVGSMIDVPVLATDAGGASLRGMLAALGAVHALGLPISARELFADRYTRPFDPERAGSFFVNPCELAPNPERSSAGVVVHPTIVLDNAAAPADNGTQTQPAVIPNERPIDLVRRLVAERAELPVEAVRDTMRLLGDLHLNSITVGQIVVESARGIGIAPPAAPTQFAGATVAELAEALELLRATGGEAAVEEADAFPAGVESWVCAFATNRVATARPEPAALVAGGGRWEVLSPAEHPLAGPLRALLGDLPGTGVVVCVPANPDISIVPALLKGAQQVSTAPGSAFVVVQHGAGAAGFARTLHLERPSVPVVVVDIPFDLADAPALIAAEIAARDGYRERYYDGAGAYSAPEMERLVLDTSAAERLPLAPADLLLVTGGGKGIAAECALMLAQQSGAALLLMGRSNPAEDPELAANLARFADAGITFRYVRADVGNRQAVHAAIAEGTEALGRPVTAFLHGAGTNVPQLIDTLDVDAVGRTLGPKVDGARNVLDALDPDALGLLITFSSIIGRAGLRGEADYALANEWLSELTEEWAREHPNCRCHAIEWSIWSGVGMGERLGRVEALMREGIQPISPDAGLEMLRRLLAAPAVPVAAVVASRFGSLPTVRMAERDLPLLRFIEQPTVHYPGLELVLDIRLSLDTDPYLRDHTFAGEHLFPAVMGLEAFAQAAVALTGAKPDSIRFADIRFDRPIIVPANGDAGIRIAALLHDDGTIRLALRCEETSYAVDHFSASCRVNEATPGMQAVAVPAERIEFDADTVMYKDVLFQRGRFRRVRGYRQLRAVECIAEIALDHTGGWFGRYLPGGMILGDAGMRDAAIHGIQGCIPHMTLLPVAVRSITVLGIAAGDKVFVHARETSHEGANFVYDIDVIDASGKVIERWEGLLLRAMERNRHRGPWDPALLGPYLERRIGELAPRAQLSVAVNTTPGERRERSNGALHAALDGSGTVSRRPDGKPVVNGANGVEANGNGAHVSAAHSGGIAIAVAGHDAVGVDIESVAPRTEAIWNDLLGNDRYRLALLMSRESGEQSDTAATRVWCSAESMLKLGLVSDAPLTLSAYDTDGWALLRSGARTIATYAQPPESGEHVATVVAIAFTAEPSESRAIAQVEELPREAPSKAKRNGRAGDRSVASGATTGVIAAEPEAGKP